MRKSSRNAKNIRATSPYGLTRCKPDLSRNILIQSGEEAVLVERERFERQTGRREGMEGNAMIVAIVIYDVGAGAKLETDPWMTNIALEAIRA